MELDWHVWVAGGVIAVGLAIKPVLMAWSRALVRQAETFYGEQPKAHSHKDKQQAAKDALKQTWAGRAASKSMMDIIKPGESDRPPKN